ncbi:MAG: YkvA family protein [Elusimicrobiota bacterium]
MNLKKTARNLKSDVFLLYHAFRDKRTPWYARLIAVLVVLYAVSPVDLIPDFIPVIGHLDDIIIIPLGIYMAFRLIPPEVLKDHRARSEEAVIKLGKIKMFFIISIVVVWAVVIFAVAAAVVYLLKRVG